MANPCRLVDAERVDQCDHVSDVMAERVIRV